MARSERLEKVDQEFSKRIQSLYEWQEESRVEARRLDSEEAQEDAEPAMPGLLCENPQDEECCAEQDGQSESVEDIRDECVCFAYKQARTHLKSNMSDVQIHGIKIMLALNQIGR